MAIQLNMQKAADSIRLNLQKAGILTPPSIDVAFDLDVSGSFDDEHCDGTTTDIMTRLVPWGLVFDPDKKLDVFTFSDTPDRVHYVGEATESNYAGYVKRNIIGKVPGYGRGTDYSYVLEANLRHFGWMEAAPVETKTSVFGGWFGSKKPAPTVSVPLVKRKSLVLFLTDGENFDKARTKDLLRKMQDSKYEMYVMFLGYSNQSDQFAFIEEMGELFDNTGFHAIKDPKKFINASDEQLNEWLITDELVTWLKK